MTPAIVKVLRGRARVVNARFELFRHHYAFEAEFCAPAKGNEKGGVEGGVKFVRRNPLTPVPDVESWDELDALLGRWMAEDDDRVPSGRATTVGELWSAEVPVLIPVPRFPFDSARPHERKVSAFSLVSFRTNLYSVPVEFVGQRVTIKCYAEHLEIHATKGNVARHDRLYGKDETSFQLEHYLPLLEWKPRAFDRAAPVRAARLKWSPAYDLLLRVFRDREGDAEGTRCFIRVLWLHKYHPIERVDRAVSRALTHVQPTFAAVLAYVDGERRAEMPYERLGEEALRPFPNVRVDTGDVTLYERLHQGGK